MPSISCLLHLAGASLAQSSGFPGRAGHEPSASCPWQGPAASVRVMKPSGCDTISSKFGREPLPVPVREGGRVPINKTILERREKAPFVPAPCASPRFIFISVRAPARPHLHRDHNCALSRHAHCIGVGSTPTPSPQAARPFQQHPHPQPQLRQ